MVRNVGGFTLMEILVVVTIIGILAAIAVPSYIHAVEKGKEDACAANVQILLTQVERYRLEHGVPIELKANQTLVEFLREKGYLQGQDIQCPFAAGDNRHHYVLVTEGDRQVVQCTHTRGG